MAAIVYENKPTQECGSVCAIVSAQRDADARLIAAAPELYEALREAVIDRCHLCGGIRKCKNDEGYCFVTQWRKSLEKAGGAE